ncbi:MAG: hypothetical protein ACE5GB_00755 [Acidimicrobiales bacterium]
MQVRAGDLEPGDVVNRRGPERTGWIEVAKVETLPDGGLVVHDDTERDSFTAKGYDLVWLQTLEILRANSHLPLPGT